MAFSILSSKLATSSCVIEKILERFRVPYEQTENLGINVLPYEMGLKDYNTLLRSSYSYFNDTRSIVRNDSRDMSIYPIVKFEEIKENSEIEYETRTTFSIFYGSGLESQIVDGDTIQKINIASMMGNIIETDRKITFYLSSDGEKRKLRVYRNNQTGEEYVFMNRKNDGTFDDSMNFQATFIGRVSPLRWTVDKTTGIAICRTPVFYSERLKCDYEHSELSKFLESDEFLKELGVYQTKSKEKTSSVNSPFGSKKERLNLEQKIKRILMGEKRIPYLVGHPGIGKTQIAKSINKNCLSFNIATFTPDAFTGKTSIIPGEKTIIQEGNKTIEHSEKGKTATTEPEWYTKLVAMSNMCHKSNERCVLLLDEFDKLTPNMQVFINGIVDSPRTIAGWEIPDNVDIILAGNTLEYSEASFNISGEVASRLTKLEVSASAIDWLKWATKHDVDPIVRAYLHNFPNKIIQDVKDKDGDYDYALSLTPRSWEQKISEELKASRKIKEFPYLEPYMDKKNREEFEEFMEMYFKLGVEDILKGNISVDIYALTDDKIQIIISCLIATATTEEEIINSLKFIDQNNLSEYKELFYRRWIEINNTDEDLIKLRLAQETVERSTGYGK